MWKSSRKVRKGIIAAVIVSLLLIAGLCIRSLTVGRQGGSSIEISRILDLTSERNDVVYDHVIVSGEDRFSSLVAVPLSCWYDISDNSSVLLPLLVGDSEPAARFVSLTGRNAPLIPGPGKYSSSLEAARAAFSSPAGAILVPEGDEGYDLALMAVPMASYLNIPVVVLEDALDPDEVERDLMGLGISYVIAVSGKAVDFARKMRFDRVEIRDAGDAILDTAEVVRDRFGRLDYVTMTNPGDTRKEPVVRTTVQEESVDLRSLLIDTSTRDVDLIGESVTTHLIDVPKGVFDLVVEVNFTDVKAYPMDPLKNAFDVEPISFMTLTDHQGRLAGYSPSFSVGGGSNIVETLVVDAPGTYELEVKVYYGVKGLSTMMGTSFGISRFEGSYDMKAYLKELSHPHLPVYRDLSMMAPYLSAARGGLVFADPSFCLTPEEMNMSSSGYAAGPWYERDLLPVWREKAVENAGKLGRVVDMLPPDLSESYLNGRGWLALLGGGSMLPMSYEEKDPSWEEDEIWGTGWATDLPYSLNLSLSVGRPLGRDVSECSALIARTLFYEEYTEGHCREMEREYGARGGFKDHFHFLAGEGGGRTGWLFHQSSFSRTVEDSGFVSEVYVQDYENGREYLVSVGAFERANYFEMILHGDWSWFSPELNGWDRYSTGVKVSDIMSNPSEWELGPSVMISGVCLLGRLGGIRPEQSITQAFFHAGINAFFCATRSTGSEAKAGPLEEALIFEDLSTGEAIRNDKRTNTEVPTYYVRTLYGDPAFNPYEPGNGYSDQGRPILLGSA